MFSIGRPSGIIEEAAAPLPVRSAEAHQLIMDRAAKIEQPELRQMFLEDIPVHHMLLTAFKQQ